MDQAVTDPIAYFHDRLHNPKRNRGHLRIRVGQPRRVKRRICMRIPGGSTEVIPRADPTMVVRCSRGSLWITHDSDPKDVVLHADEAYHAEREDTMRMHALVPCVVEIEFEDEEAA